MKYRTLGRTHLTVSEIACGTWSFASNAYGAVSEEDAVATVRAALDVGINFFDTAPLYGSREQDGISEIILGKALGADRDKVLISTKFGRKPSDGYAPFFNGAYCTGSVEESLARLATDRIDVLFFHSPFSPDEIDDDVWDALNKLRESGKVGFVGHSISEFENTQAMERQWAADGRTDAIQVVTNLINRQSKDLIRDLGEQGVGVVARECLANGFLTDAVQRDTVFAEGNLNKRYSREEIVERVEHIEKFHFLRNEQLQSTAQIAMCWVLDNEHVSTVLTGTSSKEQLRECAAASDAALFSAQDLAKAESLHQKDYAAA